MVTRMSAGVLKMVAWARKTGIRQRPGRSPRWADRTLSISTNGQRSGKSLRLRPNILCGVASGYRRGPFRGPVAGTLSNILVHMNSAKTIALLTKNRPAGPGCRA